METKNAKSKIEHAQAILDSVTLSDHDKATSAEKAQSNRSLLSLVWLGLYDSMVNEKDTAERAVLQVGRENLKKEFSKKIQLENGLSREGFYHKQRNILSGLIGSDNMKKSETISLYALLMKGPINVVHGKDKAITIFTLENIRTAYKSLFTENPIPLPLSISTVLKFVKDQNLNAPVIDKDQAILELAAQIQGLTPQEFATMPAETQAQAIEQATLVYDDRLVTESQEKARLQAQAEIETALKLINSAASVDKEAVTNAVNSWLLAQKDKKELFNSPELKSA